MNDAQKQLARSALGLPTDSERSYRNRFYANRGGPQHERWTEMVNAGHAIRHHTQSGSGLVLFELTRTGAEAALNEGETLCPEDFPPIEAAATR